MMPRGMHNLERGVSRDNCCTGTSLVLGLRDSSGLAALSGAFTVQSGGTYYPPLIRSPFSFSSAGSDCLNGPTAPTSGSTTSPSTSSSSDATLGATKPRSTASSSSASSYVHRDYEMH